MLIFNRCISGLMPNLIKKSWKVSNNHVKWTHRTYKSSKIEMTLLQLPPYNQVATLPWPSWDTSKFLRYVYYIRNHIISLLLQYSKFFIMSIEFDKDISDWSHSCTHYWSQKWHWFFHETCNMPKNSRQKKFRSQFSKLSKSF